MLGKIRLGSSLAALVLFFLPWLDIQCSEKSMATQSGVQVIYGGSTISDELKQAGGGSGEAKKSDDSPGVAPLVALALAAVIAAVAASLISVVRGGAGMLAKFLPTVALVLLLVQWMVGFPVKNEISESMSPPKSEVQPGEDALAGLGTSMAAAMMMNIRVKVLPAFYLTLVALGVPTLLLANEVIDKARKSGTPAG